MRVKLTKVCLSSFERCTLSYIISCQNGYKVGRTLLRREQRNLWTASFCNQKVWVRSDQSCKGTVWQRYEFTQRCKYVPKKALHTFSVGKTFSVFFFLSFRLFPLQGSPQRVTVLCLSVSSVLTPTPFKFFTAVISSVFFQAAANIVFYLNKPNFGL